MGIAVTQRTAVQLVFFLFFHVLYFLALIVALLSSVMITSLEKRELVAVLFHYENTPIQIY